MVGEPGIGKSRLVAEFRECIRDTPHIWMESAGEQFFENSPFHALTEMLSQWLQLQGDANANQMLERLEGALVSAGLKLDEAVPLVADLLQLPVGDRYPALTLMPEQKRRRLFAVLMGWVFGAARLQPVVIVLEDLHWLDPSTLELQKLLAEQGATVPLMLLYTARPEFRVPWPLRAHHTQLTLNRLSARNVREMVALVTARNTLSNESVEAVIERTGGVPLFVEELTRAVLESGNARLTGREIPVTLHDSLMARLDRLGPAKDVLQIGAVIGSEFSYELLRALHPMAELDLQAALRKLTDAELLQVRGIAPDASYQLRHALIRDAAYEALLKSRRKELHRLVARTIDEKFPELKEAHPEVLARHWTEAGEIEPAIAEWTRAGQAAQERNAFAEAKEGYERALSLSNLLPESPERDLRELRLWQNLTLMLFITRGHEAPETNAASQRAAALAEKTGNLTQLCYWLSARCLTAFASGDLSGARTLADQSLRIALREGDRTSLANVYALEVIIRHCLGDLAGVEAHFAAGVPFFDDTVFRLTPTGGAVAAFAYAGRNAWMLGRADLARERMAQTMAIIEGNNPFDLALLNYHAAFFWVLVREADRAETLAVRALELSQEHQFPSWVGYSECVLGYARALLGRATEGIELISKGISRLREIGPSSSNISRFTACLADAQGRAGAVLEARETFEQALQMHTDELAWRPETFRLRGELWLKQGRTEQAEGDFRESIALARTMGAKAWELRTTMSLARVLDHRGRGEEARTMLAEIYGWFTEGLDTADLKEARGLLEELGDTPAPSA